MGYIQIPKLISGGGDEPVINIREMPNDWKYFTTLKESSNDQAYLLFKGASGSFTLSNLSGNTTVTIYGGTNGTTPLYQYRYSNTASQRKWYHWDTTNNTWVVNSTQGTSTQNTNCKFTYADLTNYPLPYGLSLYDLTGKPVTNDEHIGTTELFTVIVHNPSDAATPNFISDGFYGGTSNAGFAIPLVAYSGYAKGIKTTNTNVYTSDLEFVELLGGTNINNYQFSFNSFVGKVTIPNTVTSLGSSVFSDSRSLQEVEMGTGVTTIPNNAFNNCYNLKKVTLPNTLTTISSYAFQNCYLLTKATLPSTITSLGVSCFAYSGIKNITIPNSVTLTDMYTFQNSDLEEAKFLGATTQLFSGIFFECEKLEKVTLPSLLVDIPDELCMSCKNLKNINFPNTLQSIGVQAFYETSLEEVELPSGVLTIGNNAFDTCTKLKKAVLPNTITSVGNYLFQNNYSLKSVNIPTSLTIITFNMFNCCYALENIEIPEGILTIDANAFTHCHSLRKLEIPSTIQNINNNAFSYCSNILYYKFKSTTAPTLSNANIFSTNNTYMKILIPYNSADSYQTSSVWSGTTNSIKARQRGYGTFTQGDILPSTDQTGNYTLTWYENLDDILKTTATGTPTATAITTAPYNGELYCTIS